jgi:membrane protease YdiL (CAAX protease family)
MEAARSWFGLEVPMAAPAAPSPLDIEHPLARVLSERPSVWGVLICAAAAVVIGPLTEELIFRLLLQGWLESLERRMRRQAPLLRRVVAGFAPVTLVAVLFAAMHFRRAEDWDAQTIVCRQGIYLVASVVTVTALICWLRFAAGATLADFGIVPGKIAADVKLGLLALLAVAAPVYAVAFAAKRALPEGVVTDPIPILFLALALGILYYRTHRIVPAIVLHMAFNTIGVILALGAVR